MEMLLYMGILMILLAVLSQLFSTTIETQLSSESYSSVQADGRFIIDRLSYDIRQASSVTTPATLGASGSTLVLVINGTTYTYSVTGGNLLVNSVRMNGYNTSVSNLTFRRYGNVGGKPTINMGFTLTSLVSRNGTNNTNSYQTTVSLR